MPLKEYDAIRLRDEIKGTLGDKQAIEGARRRTPDRDKVAQHIVENVINKDRWPMHMTTLADETEYSRQLVSEVVSDYFEGVEEEPEDREPMPTNKDSPMTASPPLQRGPDEDAATDGEGIQSIWVLVDGQYREIDVTVPNDVENRSSYIRGYLDGQKS